MKKEKQKRGKKQIVLIVAGIVIGVLAVIYLAFAFYFHSHFLFHTKINGMDSSCATVSDVEDKIRNGIDGYTLSIEERDGKTETISGKDISVTPQFDGSLEECLKKQNPFGWIASLFKDSEYSMDTMISYDEDELAKVMNDLDCMDSDTQVAPENAKISEYSREDGYTVIPAEYGTTINADALKEAVNNAITNLNEDISLEDSGCYIDPEITEDDEQIKAAADILNQYAGAKITYDFGDEKEELDASEITDWFTVSDDMTVSVDEDKLASYVKELAASHNTAGQDKTLTMTGGGTVTVPGGSSGWKIDQAAEREQLLADIKSGQSVEREPEYSQRANSHGANDYGNTYVEINLTTQHLYFYKNGALVVSSDFVSGKVAADHDTPTGAYFVNSRETNRTLRGEDYESFVNYWMPFNGGVGMHDATWRSSFGGQIYLRGGSHGCINLPVSAAKTIYENIEVGDAVLVFQTAPTPDVSAPQVTPETIISEIDSIGPVTLESATIMATIRSQYNALSDEDKAKVTNYETFVADEAALSALQEGGQQQ